PELLTAWPTAVHAEGDEQDTLNRTLSLALRGLGMSWMTHVLPFQRSARVTTTPEPLVKFPTAMQKDELGQETPVSWPVRPKRFRGGPTAPAAPLAAAGGTFACAAAPTAGPSSITAAPAATAARHIRPRIATPHSQAKLLADASDRGQARAAAPSPRGER